MNFIKWMNTPTGIRTINMVLIVVMGLFMLGMAIAGTIMCMREPLIDVDWSFALMTIYAFAGVVILLTANGSPRFSLFVGGVAFAVMNFIQQLIIITQIGSVPSAIISTVMDVVMVVCCILILIGDRHSPVRLLWICAIHFATIFTAQMLDVLGFTHMFGYTTFWWMIVSCLFLVFYMILLLRPGIREDTVKNRIRKGIIVVGSKLVTGPSAIISASDADAIVGKDRSGWKNNDITGTIESEYTATVTEENRTTYLTSYTWKDEKEIRITFAADTKHRLYGSGSVLRGHSIEDVDGIRYLRLYGDEGFFIRLQIEEGEVRPAEEDTEYTEPVEYLKDKVMTG